MAYCSANWIFKEVTFNINVTSLLSKNTEMSELMWEFTYLYTTLDV
jgi:hypothetical protein